MQLLSLANVNIQQKRLFIRVDFNVPMQDGQITNDARIRAVLPTIQQALLANARVLLVSHLGRPEAGKFDPLFSLAPVAERLSALLHQPVSLLKNWIDGVELQPGQVALAENVRFLQGEEANDEMLSKKMAQLCDVFVMDAFGSAHRAHASTCGIAKFAPIACAGPLVLAEVAALEKALVHPKRPLVAVVGGSKVSSKLTILEKLADQVDCLIVGGGIANTFLAAMGCDVGKSLYEKDLISIAEKLKDKLQARGALLPLPVDVIVAEALNADVKPEVCSIHEVPPNKMILDIGPQTIKMYQKQLMTASTIIWNGPVGVFEIPALSQGTQAIAETIAQSTAFSLAGGGDTLAAIEKYGVEKNISYVSTGGGAFLEFLSGIEFPALECLKSGE